jgi:hypothetical protein
VRQGHGQRHALLRLVRGVTEHEALHNRVIIGTFSHGISVDNYFSQHKFNSNFPAIS